MTGGSWVLSVGGSMTATKLPALGTEADGWSHSPGSAQQLEFGTGSGAASIFVAQTRTLGAGASETLNLYDGSVVDVFDDPAAMRLLKSFALHIPSGGGGDTAGVTVGAAASNAHPLFFGANTHTQTVYPAGPPMTGGSPDGVAVTSSACNVLVTNNGAVAVTYRVLIAGAAEVSGAAMGVLGLTYP